MRHNRDMNYFLLGLLFLIGAPAYATSASVSANATACTMEYAPVCGYHLRTDNQCVGDECKVYRTYSNQCMMSADGAKFAHAGECTAKELETNGDEEGKAYAPPKGCVAWYDGCNSCSQGACTMRACLRQEPGYCTKWDETPIPVEPDGGIGNTPTPPVADGAPGAEVDAGTEGGVSSENDDIGFFSRIWLSILSWF